MTKDHQNGDGAINLTFTTAFTLQSATEARGRLIAALQGAPHLVVDCSAVDEAGIAFIQVLVAARHAAEAQGGTLRFAPQPSAALSAAFELAGLGTEGC